MAEAAVSLDATTRAALQKLADISVPAPVTWMPQTWGWAVLAAVALALLGWAFERGLPGISTFQPLIVCKRHQQNTIRGGHTHAHNRAHQRRHAEGSLGDKQHPDDAGHGARERRENNKRIQPGLEIYGH